MRVVFDSNIFISALVIPGSKAEKAIKRIIEGTDSLILSKVIIDEVLTVLAKKFGSDREHISRTAIYIADLGEIINPSKKLKIVKDDPDNRILECAMSGKAELIVTGDKELLSLGKFQNIKIVSLRDYLIS
ncbi:MAG: putative toxin-antitoxin system toxin component, PIN family [Nitrospiraceae bacterium]|nr:MAG: putative toxin-antitoxin system toxin component, PIN family [Nitrospiraceae bacterium]